MTVSSMLAGNPSVFLLEPGNPPLDDPIVDVQGSKNCFNHLGAVALAGDDLHLGLDGVPRITDLETVARILLRSGTSTVRVEDELLTQGRPTNGEIDPGAARLRVSICYAAALAANIGWAVCPFPGGDAFTERPIDLHLRVLQATGAECTRSHRGEVVSIRFPSRPRAFDLDLTGRYGPSMGASVTALLVAAQAAGVSTLRGLCPEPEVAGVVAMLRALGVAVHDLDPGTVRVQGVDGPLSGRVRMTVPPDRIEAATYLVLGALRHRRTSVAGIALHELPSGLREALTAVGLQLREDRTPAGLPVTTVRRTGALHAVDLRTGPHPQFPTDVQPQMAALLTQAGGTSSITERVYASRVTHVPELARLGLRIGVHGSRQVVPGDQEVRGGRAAVHDIRSGAALLVAAAACAGPVLLHDPDGHLARGYGDLRLKLGRLGMDLSGPDGAPPVPRPPVRSVAPVSRPVVARAVAAVP